MFRSFIGHFFKHSRYTLDNFVFRLHYRVTLGFLLVSAVLILWKINFGTPIRCLGREIDSEFANDHCWYDGTFTNPEARSKSVGVEVPYPGIDSYSGNQERESHNMHRWVVIGILVQALFFYIPRLLWKSLEGRRVHKLLWNLNDPKVLGDRKVIRKQHISNFLRVSSPGNILYAFGHVLCEILNMLNVIVQLFLVSHILQVSFASVDIFTKSRSERNDTSALESFPLYTKCVFNRYGASGAVQKYSILCMMSINGVLEVIFACQWIWFVLLAILSILALLYRLVTLMIPQIRMLKLQAKTKLTPRATVENVTRRLAVGEWFLVYLLSKNLDPVHMRDILESLAEGTVYKDESHALSMM